MKKVPKIVVLGGGNAMPNAVLTGLKKHKVKLSVISAMLDDGGFAGRERELFQTKVSFGDIRRAALALSEIPQERKEFLGRRFENGAVLANSYCTNIAVSLGLKEVIEEIKEDFNIPPHCELLPSTLDEANLCAELENGQVIRGETNINIPKHDGNLKIKKVFLEPEARAYPPGLEEIKKADLIVIGPGDLFSSLVQILLINGIAKAVRKSQAKKVYICNLMTKRGETNNFSVAEFLFEIERYLGGLVDYVIYNKKHPLPQRVAAYRKKHPECLGLVKFYGSDKKRFIGTDLVVNQGPIVHDPEKLAKTILKLCAKQ